jgi:hypothetical protein
MRATLLFLCATAALSACDVTSPSNVVREPSILEVDDTPATVTVPASARAGQAFTIRIVTHSLSSCTTKGEVTLGIQGRTADLSPFDLTRTGDDVSCAEVASLLIHEPVIGFAQPGTATINVHGRRMPSGQILTVTRTIEILPAN